MTSFNTFCNPTIRRVPRIKIVGDGDLPRIHEPSNDLLANTGIIFEHEEALGILRKHGAKVEGKTVFIPKDMAETAMEQTPAI